MTKQRYWPSVFVTGEIGLEPGLSGGLPGFIVADHGIELLNHRVMANGHQRCHV